MKSMIIKSAVALIAALPLFTACQGEPEVGTLLHPEEQPSNAPKVYINEVAIVTGMCILEIVANFFIGFAFSPHRLADICHYSINITIYIIQGILFL